MVETVEDREEEIEVVFAGAEVVLLAVVVEVSRLQFFLWLLVPPGYVMVIHKAIAPEETAACCPQNIC